MDPAPQALHLETLPNKSIPLGLPKVNDWPSETRCPLLLAVQCSELKIKDWSLLDPICDTSVSRNDFFKIPLNPSKMSNIISISISGLCLLVYLSGEFSGVSF